MWDKIETVMIETENGPVRINKSDFDEEIHTIFAEEAEEPTNIGDGSKKKMIDGMKKSELVELAESEGIEIDMDMKKDELKEIILFELFGE